MSLEGIFNIISKSPGFEKLKGYLSSTWVPALQQSHEQFSVEGVFVIGGGLRLLRDRYNLNTRYN